MPSLRGQVLAGLLSLYRSVAGHQTSESMIDKLDFETNNLPQTLPSSIRASPHVKVAETVFPGVDGADDWQVFTMTPVAASARKVVIYFHGGGFIGAVSRRVLGQYLDIAQQALHQTRQPRLADPHLQSASLEYKTAFKFASELNCPLIYPSWTLAPFSCAEEFTKMSVAFALHVAADPRYRGMQIVFAGGSAGGWCALDTVIALCRDALTTATGPAADSRRTMADSVLDRTMGAILFCAVVDAEVTDDVNRIGQTDPLLSGPMIQCLGRNWLHGPCAFPRLLARLPEDRQAKARVWAERTQGVDLCSPLISIRHDIGLIEKWARRRSSSSSSSSSPTAAGSPPPPPRRPLNIVSYVGSRDVCAAGLVLMHRDLDAMSNELVQNSLVVAEGMFHGYMTLPLPESAAMWKSIEQFMLA